MGSTDPELPAPRQPPQSEFVISLEPYWAAWVQTGQTHLAPASSAGNVKFVDFVVASTISEMERDATGKTARAFYEFWNTGDEALPKKALAEKLCQLRRTAAVRAGNNWFAAQQAPRGVRKGVEMITLKMISEKFNAGAGIETRCANCLSFLIMNCAISASAAATSKTSCAARVRAERTRKAPAFSRRRANSAVPSTMTMSTEAASAAAPSGSAILPRSK